MTDDLTHAFGQLRDAYRLIWSYTRRIRDVIALVDAECRQQGFDFNGWSPLHNKFPPQSTSDWFNKGNWAWDLLPAYAMYFTWSKTTGKTGSRHVILTAEPDTGFNLESWPQEPDPATWAERGRSEVRLLLVDLPTAPKASHELRNKVAKCAVGAETGTEEVTIGQHGYAVETAVVPMQELACEADVKRLLVAPIERWGGR